MELLEFLASNYLPWFLLPFPPRHLRLQKVPVKYEVMLMKRSSRDAVIPRK